MRTGEVKRMVLSEIHVYPVKSCAGIALERARLGARGIRHDRHWMAVGADGGFLSQRQHPAMALIRTALTPGGVRLEAPGVAPLELPLADPPPPWVEVGIWGDRCQAGFMGEAAARWISRYLRVPARLVCLPATQCRQVDLRYAREGDQVGFADGFPLLLISRASLEDLNARLGEPLPMARFRPNLVVDGCAAYAEDGWRRIRIGGIELRLVKPCSRCQVITVDQATARPGVEPLRTLARYRARDNKVFFGQNLIHMMEGELATGMPIEVLEHASE
ncbi:MAG: MOSC domain-containing protein [Candidatus Sedimenticola endophacoides]|uniref:MOSC domain-containing protein n=1 Tax=Candidatus Sedimenticola endophacoides TaxID=2548426 RepID=A0A6N4DJU1_9GAMM|nr:MAG: MOSC domain-containing protein [Candidatus Sedimenticola endophacoides]OQX39461.1 MAG: MOSC domain-containing protein [Candidatus Sedimenticola endophacoides]PUD98670.1 MAG: MOSC domain-containing protein [Candidatus Sedimenticola endophacoides]PUD99321.1 MAG: MOSC domain-containing protein [Candidatus Sedimenticola endophacoides]PUE02951.1 MAG: MOSC domain-containing protein [Candidatus Sedimenticola endophacoides]